MPRITAAFRAISGLRLIVGANRGSRYNVPVSLLPVIGRNHDNALFIFVRSVFAAGFCLPR